MSTSPLDIPQKARLDLLYLGSMSLARENTFVGRMGFGCYSSEKVL
jgi:hypothetical protein